MRMDLDTMNEMIGRVNGKDGARPRVPFACG
jgi:hypothetical protein